MADLCDLLTLSCIRALLAGLLCVSGSETTGSVTAAPLLTWGATDHLSGGGDGSNRSECVFGSIQLCSAESDPLPLGALTSFDLRM